MKIGDKVTFKTRKDFGNRTFTIVAIDKRFGDDQCPAFIVECPTYNNKKITSLALADSLKLAN